MQAERNAPTETWRERFWKYVGGSTEPGGCWEWLGSRDQHGYGRLQRGGRGGGLIKAHRASYILHIGPLADGEVVRHRCDNPPCVNPGHLLAGTMKDNTADMLERGREARRTGADNPRTLIPDETIVEIRERAAAGASYAQIAAAYDMTEKYACALVTGRRRAAAGGPIQEADDVRWTIRPRVLRYMDDDADGPITATTLGRELGLKYARTVLNSMRRVGLVRRIPEQGGGRYVTWELTAEGSRKALEVVQSREWPEGVS